MFRFTLVDNVDDVRMSFPYLIIATNNNLLQYDMHLKYVISTFPNATVGWRMQLFKNAGIITYQHTSMYFSKL